MGRGAHTERNGAFGEFEATHDISDVISASFLNKVGKKTPLLARFSAAVGEKGSADSRRDGREFAFMFYTAEGNLDWAFLGMVRFLPKPWMV